MDKKVQQLLDKVTPAKRKRDAETMLEMMGRVTGQPPVVERSAVGYGRYHYKYDSGREGDGHTIGFYPRKGKLTIYLMDGTARHSELLAKLGKHTTTGYCVYIKRLSDVDLPVLERIVQASYDFVESKSQGGPIRQILWKSDE